MKRNRVQELSVCVGVLAYESPRELNATLAALQRNSSAAVGMLLLLDGPDEAIRLARSNWSHIAQSETSEPRGAAACFNRLAIESDSDIVVLLESGSLVGPGWLDHLVAALDSDPRNGLAGPSTNASWNEQCTFPNRGGSETEISATSREAWLKFGTKTKTLEPLYSLADFCYVVRRKVIETIGAADEAYGSGPCWEMDYNIRAARAGFQGVWACASFVYRSPFTSRRRQEEQKRFEINKQIYQNRFCGGRLRGVKEDYRYHCRGDDCPNFAPTALIQISRPFSPLTPVEPVAAPPVFAESSPTCVASTQMDPLVTCIMPTFNRRRFVPQAIRCFLRQDYSRSRLLIVDDGSEAVGDLVPEDPRIRYMRLDSKVVLGAKRNFACRQAEGEIIVHWDDDDWYPSWRVSRQVHALLSEGVDICGSSRILHLNQLTHQAWEYKYKADRPWVGGNTLAYRKQFWERNPFPEIQIGEDSLFVWNSVIKTISDLSDPSLCVATIHGANTSPKQAIGMFWTPQSIEVIRSILKDDFYFYSSPTGSGQGDAWPLISCIMPTYCRRPFVPLAVRSFVQQDYPNKELIVVDDGEDAIGDLLDNLPAVRYFHLNQRTSIGEKRNFACRNANGTLIAHWDDDDWYAIDRLRYQATPLILGEADITGVDGSLVLELENGAAWTLSPGLHQRLFVGNVHGGTLVYDKKLWTEGRKYPDVNIAEDAWLLQDALARGRRLKQLSNPNVFVYMRHKKNAWKEFNPGKFIQPDGWNRIPSLIPLPRNPQRLQIRRRAAHHKRKSTLIRARCRSQFLRHHRPKAPHPTRRDEISYNKRQDGVGISEARREIRPQLGAARAELFQHHAMQPRLQTLLLS